MVLSRIISTSCSVNWAKKTGGEGMRSCESWQTFEKKFMSLKSINILRFLTITRESKETVYPFDTLLKLVINKERQVFWWARVEVQEILKVSCHSLFEEFIVAEGLDEEVIKSWLKVEEALPRSKLIRGYTISVEFILDLWANLPPVGALTHKTLTWTYSTGFLSSPASVTRALPCSLK